MSTAITLDDCLFHLFSAQESLKDYTEIDVYQSIFEAEDPKVKEQIERNSRASKSAIDHVKSALDYLIELANKLIDGFKNFLSNLTMSKEERISYDEFKAACKKDPTLKNKKVTVMDYRKMRKEYEALLKEVEEADKALAANKEYPLDKLLKKIEDFGTGAGKGILTSVTAEVAVRIAQSSQDFASLMNTAIQHDKTLLESMRQNIGKSQTKKFENEIKSYSKRATLKRKWLAKHNQLATSVEGAVRDTFSNKGLGGIVKRSLGNKEINSAAKEVGFDAMQGGIQAVKHGFSVRSTEKREQKDDARNQKHQAYGDLSHQTAFDSLTGKNDPNVQARRQAKADKKRAKQEKKQNS